MLFLITFLLHADTCSNVPNVATGNGGVYQQLDTDWCHAHTATDMMTQNLQRRGLLKPGERLHPLGTFAALPIARRMATGPGNLRHKQGAASADIEAVENNTKYGYKLCRESELGDVSYRTNATFQKGREEEMGFVMDMAGETRIEPSSQPCRLDRDYEGVIRIGRMLDKIVWAEKIRTSCKVNVPKFNWDSQWEPKWSDDTAESETTRPDPRREKLLRGVIDRGLAKKILVGINFNPDFMLRKERRHGGKHWLSIVGRERTPAGVCRYLLRNSWGEGCAAYEHPEDCDKGHIWVSAEELVRHMDSAQYLK